MVSVAYKQQNQRIRQVVVTDLLSLNWLKLSILFYAHFFSITYMFNNMTNTLELIVAGNEPISKLFTAHRSYIKYVHSIRQPSSPHLTCDSKFTEKAIIGGNEINYSCGLFGLWKGKRLPQSNPAGIFNVKKNSWLQKFVNKSLHQ